MIPIPPNAHTIFDSLPAGALQQRWAFRPERWRVVFTRKNNKTLLQERIKKVHIQLITVGPEDVAETDPLPITTDLIPALLTATLEFFGVQEEAEADLTNDNQ